MTVTLETQAQEAPGDGRSLLKEAGIAALRGIHDPEIPVNIYDLGLIYRLDIDDDGNVSITMTLTTPGCPVAGTMPGQVECAVREVPGVRSARVELVWDPPWTRDRLDDITRLELGLL
jgi:FeS assembly SUF system protein